MTIAARDYSETRLCQTDFPMRAGGRRRSTKSWPSWAEARPLWAACREAGAAGTGEVRPARRGPPYAKRQPPYGGPALQQDFLKGTCFHAARPADCWASFQTTVPGWELPRAADRMDRSRRRAYAPRQAQARPGSNPGPHDRPSARGGPRLAEQWLKVQTRGIQTARVKANGRIPTPR